MQVQANDILINYELTGKQNAPVLMLSHSLGSSLAMWDPQVPVFENHYRVLRYDTRGHGGSDAPEGEYSLDLLADDAIALLDALDIAKAHWIGLSMGGMIGQNLALRHADRLHSVSLCSTTSVIPDEAQPVWQERITLAREQGMQALVEATLERWFTPPYLAENSPGVRLIRQHFLATPVAGYIGCSEAIRRLNYLDRLADIDKPTLIVVGENDPGTPVTASEAMHQRIPGSQMQVIPAAAHLSSVEQMERFNQIVLAFLATVE